MLIEKNERLPSFITPPRQGVGLRCIYAFLALNAAGAVAARKRFYLLTGNEVEVAGDCMLQRGRRYAEFQRGLEVLTVQKAGDYAARKAVAAAYTVNDRGNSV